MDGLGNFLIIQILLFWLSQFVFGGVVFPVFFLPMNEERFFFKYDFGSFGLPVASALLHNVTNTHPMN